MKCRIVCRKTQTRTADDKFLFAGRVESISFIIDATERFCRIDSFCNASKNSDSSVILVW